jgi:peptidoglycan/LPS O-acetylase OafA/YrhL
LLGIGGLLLNWQRVPDPIKYSFGTAFLALSLALLPSASNWVKSTLAFPWLQTAGLLSFSLYLWQQPLYIAAQSDMIWVVYALILAIILAAASYLLVEKPARLFLNRWFEEKKRRKNPLCDPVL